MKRTVQSVLAEARVLLAEPAHWTQDVTARDAAGMAVAPDNPSAVCFCLMGALMKVAPAAEGHMLRYYALSRLATAAEVQNITEFNDSIQTTHSVVLAVLDKAIERNAS